MSEKPTLRKVTVRPSLTAEEDARIAALATRYGLSKEKAVGELLKRGVRLADAGDAELNRALREAALSYRAARTRARKPRKLKTAKDVGG